MREAETILGFQKDKKSAWLWETKLADLDGGDCEDLMLQNLQGDWHGGSEWEEDKLSVSVAEGNAVTFPVSVGCSLGDEMHVTSSHGAGQSL